MEPMELRISSELAPQEIIFNFDELKATLTDRLAYYNTLVVTEDTIKEGKADRATLNKLRDAIESRRKDIKKQCLAPYEAFEAKVKELVALIDSPIAAIDTQVKSFEEAKKREKRNKIYNIYDRLVPAELTEIIPITRIYEKRWSNVSTSLESVEQEIQAYVNKVRADLMALDAVEPEFRTAVRAKYVETLDLGEALRHKETLKATAAQFKEPTPTVNPPEEVKPAEAVQTAQSAPVEVPQEAEHLEKVYCLRLEMQVTKSQANALKRFLVENNISHTKI